jgi:hypothetical protein
VVSLFLLCTIFAQFIVLTPKMHHLPPGEHRDIPKLVGRSAF